MRTKTLLFMLVIMAITLCVLTVTALAANETSMSTTIAFTKEAPPPSEPGLPSSTYEVNIPAVVTIDNPEGFTEFYITANSVDLPDGQSVAVSVDNASFNEDGYLHLKNSNDDTIRVSLRVRYDYYITTLNPNDIIAKFDHSGIPASEYGAALLLPLLDEVEAAPPGAYTGTLYFKISVVND